MAFDERKHRELMDAMRTFHPTFSDHENAVLREELARMLINRGISDINAKYFKNALLGINLTYYSRSARSELVDIWQRDFLRYNGNHQNEVISHFEAKARKVLSNHSYERGGI